MTPRAARVNARNPNLTAPRAARGERHGTQISRHLALREANAVEPKLALREGDAAEPDLRAPGASRGRRRGVEPNLAAPHADENEVKRN